MGHFVNLFQYGAESDVKLTVKLIYSCLFYYYDVKHVFDYFETLDFLSTINNDQQQENIFQI